MKKKWSIGWGISSACNMNCQFCYSKHVREKSSDLKYDDWVRFIDENYNEIKSINYGTGENAIYDDWFRFVDYVHKNYKIEQALTTNGYVSQRMKDNMEFEEIVLRSISEIDISLDYCIPNKHNEFRGQPKAYEWAINMLKYCKENNKKTTIVFIGTNDNLNIENIKGLFAIAKEYNAKLRMNIYRPTNGINEQSKRFIADYKTIIDTLTYISDNYKILALSDTLFSAILTDDIGVADPSGKDSLRILPDGSITPSTYLITEKFRKYNIRDRKVLSNLVFDKDLVDRSIPDNCKGCEWESSCAGGVLDRRYLWHKRFDVRDPYCPKREGNYIPATKVKVTKTSDFSSIHDGYLPTIFFSN